MDQMNSTLWASICARADATPLKQMAIDEAGRTMTFAEYRDACEVSAAGLADRGVGAGSVVCGRRHSSWRWRREY